MNDELLSTTDDLGTADIDVEVDAAAGSLKTSMPLFYTDLVKSSLNVYS